MDIIIQIIIAIEIAIIAFYMGRNYQLDNMKHLISIAKLTKRLNRCYTCYEREGLVSYLDDNNMCQVDTCPENRKELES